MTFQKVCAVTFCHPNIATHTRAFAGVIFCNQKLPSLLEEFADFSAAHSDCADPCVTHPCLSFCQAKSISLSQCGGPDLPSLMHCPQTFCPSSTGLSPATK